jgi:hypothetical protein
MEKCTIADMFGLGFLPILLFPVLCAGKICQPLTKVRWNLGINPSNLAEKKSLNGKED